MPRAVILILAVPLIGIAGFCMLGFAATYESPDYVVLRWIYACVALLSLAGAIALVFSRRSGAGRGFPIEPTHRDDKG